TDDAEVIALRRQLRRNLLSSLLLAQGVPLILAGDEVGNSQSGNNNAYCQDNEIGWVDWSRLGNDDEDMTAPIGRLTQLRQQFPQLQGQQWLDTPSATLKRGTIAAGSRLTAPERSVLVSSGQVPRVARLWRRSSRPTRSRPGSAA